MTPRRRTQPFRRGFSADGRPGVGGWRRVAAGVGMRRVSMATRNELVAAVAERYARSDRVERGRILDEFVAVTGHHRKHAMRLLRHGGGGPAGRRGRRDRVYG